MKLTSALLSFICLFPDFSLAAHLRHDGKTSHDGKVNPKSYRQTLHNLQNVQYFADFQIGGQNISGIFDTGSFEVVVRGSRCQGCASPVPPFDYSKSKDYKPEGKLVLHSYGSGPCLTMLGRDTVKVGPDFVAKDQGIWEMVSHKIPVLNAAKFAAIVGIGPMYGYNSKEKTLLMNFDIDEFSICLLKGNGADGYLYWGPDGEEIPKAQVNTAKVIGKHHWVTTLSDVGFSGQKRDPDAIPVYTKDGFQTDPNTFRICEGKGACSAIIDSGTSLIAAPTSALMQLSKFVGRINPDCSNLHELPVLKFKLDGQDFELPPQAYVMRLTGASLQAQDIWELLFFKPKIRKLNQCTPAFMQMDMMSPHGSLWIMGMPFLRYFHTTFNRQTRQMTFAKAGKDCKPEPMKEEPKDGKSKSLLSYHHEVQTEAFMPMEVDVANMIPPRLTMFGDENQKYIDL
eukprot:TRINITY_DN1318_c0_g1_i4.p1 TRINITY_DN1318_c0_g1~~TRINITY_DN1318_c0_g1_i4.p1  ORF type:complete len:455 (+),score=108.42 TRINITY_DN1318_c0_g1_i4:150-1514(+)